MLGVCSDYRSWSGDRSTTVQLLLLLLLLMIYFKTRIFWCRGLLPPISLSPSQIRRPGPRPTQSIPFPPSVGTVLFKGGATARGFAREMVAWRCIPARVCQEGRHPRISKFFSLHALDYYCGVVSRWAPILFVDVVATCRS
jgi:hypothetical protein